VKGKKAPKIDVMNETDDGDDDVTKA